MSDQTEYRINNSGGGLIFLGLISAVGAVIGLLKGLGSESALTAMFYGIFLIYGGHKLERAESEIARLRGYK